MQFSKMHCLGSDFMVVDAITQNVFFSDELIRRLACRKTGVGFDELVLVEPPYDPELDFHYRQFNHTGKEHAFCAEGAVCLGQFVTQKGLTGKKRIQLGTSTGKAELTVDNERQVSVAQRTPLFEPNKIPFRAAKTEKTYILRVEETTFFCGVVNVNGPYCVLPVQDIEQAEVDKVGAMLAAYDRFPEQTSTCFMQIVNRNKIKVRIYEHEQGEVASSLNGVCAAVAVGISQGNLDDNVSVDYVTEALAASWSDKGHSPITIAANATHIFDGFIHL